MDIWYLYKAGAGPRAAGIPLMERSIPWVSVIRKASPITWSCPGSVAAGLGRHRFVRKRFLQDFPHGFKLGIDPAGKAFAGKGEQ